MTNKNPGKKYLNKLYTLKIIGKGKSGDFFGKINGMVCFINDDTNNLDFEQIVDVKIIKTTQKCLFSEVVNCGDGQTE